VAQKAFEIIDQANFGEFIIIEFTVFVVSNSLNLFQDKDFTTWVPENVLNLGLQEGMICTILSSGKEEPTRDLCQPLTEPVDSSRMYIDL